jgi:hypothetical protein
VPLTVAALVVAVLATGATVVAGRPAHRSAATALASPATGVASSWVARENRRPGTTGWRITRLGAPYAIEGWADHVSAASGDRVGLFVSTTAPKFRVEAYRMGWYGGRGARLVWRSPQLPGRRQPPPARTPGTNLLVTRWRRSLTFTVRPAWPPGDYLLKLAASSGQRYVPLTVRDDASHSALVVQNDVTTWQAYNLWGGYDLYRGPDGSAATRSRVVSFDRPYDAAGQGAGDFLGNEYPLVRLVEALGLDVTYWTDIDLHQHPERLLAHRALMSLGHDEYWSTRMRRSAEAARDHGVNLAFLGANAIFRHIRLQPSPTGPDREEVNYKPWSARDDPAWRTDPAEVTTDWREPPLNDPESRLLGDLYECNPVRAAGVVVDPAAWLFAGTGMRAGMLLPGLVGPVRSARPVDAALLRQLGGGLFGYAGAAEGEIAPVKAYSDAVLLSPDQAPGAYRRSASRPAPHNLYTSTALLYQAAARLGARRGPPPALFRFTTRAPAGARPVRAVAVPFSPVADYVASWRWDPKAALWDRYQGAQRATPAGGAGMTAANVVVLRVEVGTIPGLVDSLGNPDPNVIVVGQGACWVFRDGRVLTGTWRRPAVGQVMRLTGRGGQTIPLHPGRTWIELEPVGYTPRLS